MTKTRKRVTGEPHVLGDRAFAAITAVEGVRLSASSHHRLKDMNRRQLSADEQRAEVIRTYASAKTRC